MPYHSFTMQFAKIETDMWSDPEFESLSKEAKLLWIYLLSNNRNNFAGIYEISKKRMELETGINNLDEALTEVMDTLPIVYQEGINTVWIKNFLSKYSPNQKQLKGVAKFLDKVKEPGLVRDFLDYHDTLDIPYTYPMDTHGVDKDKDKDVDKDINKLKSDSKSDDPSEKYNEYAPTTSRGLNYDQIKELWNERIPETLEIRNITDKRKRHLRTRYKEPDFSLKEIINEIQQQPFLLGENDRGWTVDFTWIIESQDHYTNILEGKYSDNQSTKDERILQNLLNDYREGENHE